MTEVAIQYVAKLEAIYIKKKQQLQREHNMFRAILQKYCSAHYAASASRSASKARNN